MNMMLSEFARDNDTLNLKTESMTQFDRSFEIFTMIHRNNKEFYSDALYDFSDSISNSHLCCRVYNRKHSIKMYVRDKKYCNLRFNSKRRKNIDNY